MQTGSQHVPGRAGSNWHGGHRCRWCRRTALDSAPTQPCTARVCQPHPTCMLPNGCQE